jgi:hypothetical protein
VPTFVFHPLISASQISSTDASSLPEIQQPRFPTSGHVVLFQLAAGTPGSKRSSYTGIAETYNDFNILLIFHFNSNDFIYSRKAKKLVRIKAWHAEELNLSAAFFKS